MHVRLSALGRMAPVTVLALIATSTLSAPLGGDRAVAQEQGQVIASDSLDETTSRGWGATDVGGSYRYSDADSFSAGGGYGRVVLKGAGAEHKVSLPSAVVADGYGTVSMALDALPQSGSGVYDSMLLREREGRAYRATVRVTTSGRAYLSLARLDGAGQLSGLSEQLLLPQTLGSHQWLNLAFTATGSNPVKLQAKAWRKGTTEPGWQVSASDGSSQRLPDGGYLSLVSYSSVSGGAATVYYDTLNLAKVGTSQPPAEPAPASPTPAIGTSGSVPPGGASYAVPSGALFVSPGGSNTNDGTSSRPLRTVQAALNRADDGATIVLRQGTYHERFTVSDRVTIQNYPGEVVWFDGSRVVNNFVADGAGYRADGWTPSFDSSPSFSWGGSSGGFVNSKYPMAAHPDQVWIDGAAQQQVGARSQVVAGTFYVDYSNDRLYLGSNPSGKTVRASALSRAIEVRAQGTVLRGFGVRRYAPSIPHMGTVTVERPGVTVENLAITDNATVGISFLARDVQARQLTVQRNGMLGVHGHYADNLSMTHILSSNNNTERFNMAPVSGGVKITSSRGVSLNRGQFENNRGPGFWLDESVYDAKISRSVMRGNAGHGISLEISALMVVAGNLIQNNAGFGIKVNDTSEVSVWNNTVADNDRPINIVQDKRRGDDPSVPGHDPRRPIPDPTMTWITGPVTVRNNVFAGSKGICLMCVEDYSHEFTGDQMRVWANNNVYQRDTVAAPEFAAVWSRGPGDPAVYRSLAGFIAATGRETQSLDLPGVEAVGTDGTTTGVVKDAVPSVAVGIPTYIAGFLGVAAGSKALGAR